MRILQVGRQILEVLMAGLLLQHLQAHLTIPQILINLLQVGHQPVHDAIIRRMQEKIPLLIHLLF